jgi:RNA polymerase sigma factor (sigma-70 family)
MNDSRTLVEHFFRHEYGRLVAVLTRSLGVRNFELVEDVVQSTLSNAIQVWGQKGIPENPGAWLYKSSRNLAIDALRRTQIEHRLLQSQSLSANPTDEVSLSVPLDGEVGDESLRLLFLCCHPQIPLESSIAFALKNVSGFSLDEVATALLISKPNAEKRITRAKIKLREVGTELTEVDAAAFESRLEAVQSCIYLLFNEGYASAGGHSSIRKELCEEAIRLTRMLLGAARNSIPSTSAMLALLLMQSARFDTRLNAEGAIVLLEDQDRSLWDWNRIQEAMSWMAKSATGNRLTRYHVEAAIAWEHCRAESFKEIDWNTIAEQYARLNRMQPSPMVVLNLAIAMSYSSGLDSGLKQLVEISTADRARIRPWWDCAVADLYYRLGNLDHAISHWNDGMLLASNLEQRQLIARRIRDAEKEKTPFDSKSVFDD